MTVMTEQEAREKWCPFARTIKTTSFNGVPQWEVAGNRVDANPVLGIRGEDSPWPCRCIGPDCMAWRWQSPATREAISRGYCGLAGEPKHDQG